MCIEDVMRKVRSEIVVPGPVRRGRQKNFAAQ
jgi:hypothetical protein